MYVYTYPSKSPLRQASKSPLTQASKSPLTQASKSPLTQDPSPPPTRLFSATRQGQAFGSHAMRGPSLPSSISHSSTDRGWDFADANSGRGGGGEGGGVGGVTAPAAAGASHERSLAHASTSSHPHARPPLHVNPLYRHRSPILPKKNASVYNLFIAQKCQ
jgi:hypothetical protein